MFPEEIKGPQQGKTVIRRSALYRLSPVLQDKILRVGGRLSRSAMPEESKHLAILTRDHCFTSDFTIDTYKYWSWWPQSHVVKVAREILDSKSANGH